ncbi:MAG: PKD domain-containing protein [Methylococcales bacterium]
MNTFKQFYNQSIGRNVVLGIMISGFLTFSALVIAAPTDIRTSNNNVLGENPEHKKLNTILGNQSLQTKLQSSGILQSSGDHYKVRVIYMIPSNRSPQHRAKQKLQDYVVRMQDWYREEMERLGYGSKSFIYETEFNSKEPKVNFVYVPQPDTAFQGGYGDRWGKILDALVSAGYSPWQRGELMLIIAETEIQNQDSSFIYNGNDSNFVGGTAVNDFTGVGLVTGETMARFPKAFLTNNQPYAGMIIDDIGPYPLVQDVTFPWFELSTLSSTSSSAQGAALHELSHGLGLGHDFRNDANFNGNLMGNGLRGLRGALYPNRYSSDDMRLDSGSALQLNYNRFFNNKKVFTEDNPPQVEIQTQNNAVEINGQCGVEFSASDIDSPLAGVLLIKNGNVVADMPLSGKVVRTTLTTYDYAPSENNEWLVQVFDRQGNRTLSSGVSLTCADGKNRAPQPFIRVSKRQLKVGDKILLDAGDSRDPDGDSSKMTVEWDLNGDGKFDTSPSMEKSFTHNYKKPGAYQIIVRLTDEYGDTSRSIPFGIRVDRANAQ